MNIEVGDWVKWGRGSFARWLGLDPKIAKVIGHTDKHIIVDGSNGLFISRSRILEVRKPGKE